MNILFKSSGLHRVERILSRCLSVKPKEEIEKLVNGKKVVVFMKGVPEQPQCGFSNAVVQILRMHGVTYDSHNVLQDESLRQGHGSNPKGVSFLILERLGSNYPRYQRLGSYQPLKNEEAHAFITSGIKEYSNWPTIPQVFINGEFVGGCDIMLQMHQSGDLIEELEKAGIQSALLDKQKEKDPGKE